jgi:transposase
MWPAKNRRRYDRSALRYPSDLTDDEWALVERLIPPAKRSGNRRQVDVRELMNGIMYGLTISPRKITLHVCDGPRAREVHPALGVAHHRQLFAPLDDATMS